MLNLITMLSLLQYRPAAMAAASPHHRFPFVFSLITLVLTLHAAFLPSCTSSHVDAIYNFGDSISDTGNLLLEGAAIIGNLPYGSISDTGNLLLEGAAIIGNLPYGQTLGKPTGRCSDGRLIIDYIAKFLKLPYLPPYLDNSASFDHGANFAVAGATALDRSFFLDRGINVSFTNNSLNVQLQWFKTHLNSKCTEQEGCKKILESALFLVGEIGGNDYNYGFMGQKTMEEMMKAFVPQVVGSIVNAVEELINLGAMRLIVPGNFPIGCFPCYLTPPTDQSLNLYQNNCIEDLNEFAKFHNDELQVALDHLRKEHPDVTIKYADYFDAFLLLLQESRSFGFNQSSLFKACCGIGGAYNYDRNHVCGTAGVPVCTDPTQFISWDGVHLTQEAYKGMAIHLVSTGLLLNM